MQCVCSCIELSAADFFLILPTATAKFLYLLWFHFLLTLSLTTSKRITVKGLLVRILYLPIIELAANTTLLSVQVIH